MIGDRSKELRELDGAIDSMIRAVAYGTIRPDRTWSMALNSLWKKREELEGNLLAS